MKRNSSQSISLKFALVAFVLVGFLTLAPNNSVQAQVTTTIEGDFYYVPIGPYVSADVAKERMEAQLDGIKVLFETMNPASQEYRNLQAMFDFYSMILRKLNEGKTVQNSIQESLDVLVSDAHSTLPKSKRFEFKQNAINILKI